MSIISVTPSDAGNETQRWSIPVETVLNQSPVPRGLRYYGGTQAIAALGANDETSIQLTLTFPTAFNYLCKAISLVFASDDLTTEFSNIGTLEYRPGGVTDLDLISQYELFSDGSSFRAAVASIQQYRPLGSWRRWLTGPDGDTLVVFLADISGDASTAGDFQWQAEFWEYDVEQCLKWPVNTPLPTISY